MPAEQDQYSDASREELLQRIATLEREAAESSGLSRRSLLGKAAVMAGVGALGVYGARTASAAPTGTFPASSDDALLKIRADRVRLVGRTSDPSSPTDGTVWYRSDL